LNWFYKIAAVFIGLLVALSFFFREESKKNDTNSINEVVTNNKVNSTIETIKKPINTEEKSLVTVQVSNNFKTDILEKKQEKIQNTKQNSTFKAKNNTVQIATNLTTKFETEKPKNTIINLNNSKDQIAMNTNKLEKQTIAKKVPTNNKEVKKARTFMHSTDADIDNLLASALKIDNTKIKRTIFSSQQLEYAVENELNKESKTRLYKMIKAGVDTVENIIVSNDN